MWDVAEEGKLLREHVTIQTSHPPCRDPAQMLQPHLRASLGQRGPCWGELRPLQNKASSRGGRLKGQGIVVGGWATSFRENWPPSLEDWASFQGQEQSHKQETKSGLLHQAETGVDQEQEGHTCAQAGTTAPHCGSPVPVVVYLKGMERVIQGQWHGKKQLLLTVC